MIWNLQVPRVRQLSLAFIFSIAAFSIIVSAIRAYYTTIITSTNFTGSRALLDIFSAIEPATSIIVASSLVLGPVFKKWVHSVFPSQSLTAKHHSFQRIRENRHKEFSGDLELGNTKTSVQGPEGDGRNSHREALGGVGTLQNNPDKAHLRGAPDPGGITVLREIIVQQEPLGCRL
ncbi:hypothetical protein MMC28_009477 [Mycoblastus sanguinarius]|nr:hypothetical protein [Mycoblastus sanguinarius]